ncbi:GNAT family N-acetyltransferase [Pseudoroseicyclus tamaricis]|uniref:GNAT family N-acetyltransferase n=1 Tax=Pseudoroseicyclus tamaricis TaxID=2705421 RepID=A0A6B2JMC8_9RHOB|nr:GNAT family N-acetyltransferase [Pseudoroseicyclus tamaricis]NDV02743.1 GNAT family N-acetyltransferase [Pseudoroseicyclus tamaricis]
MRDTPLTRIVPLAACPEQAAEAARLLEETWPDWYGLGGDGDAAADVAVRSLEDALPWGIAAQDESGALIGLCTLSGTSFGAAEGEELWLGGLVVAPHARGRGVGDALVAAVEEEARGRGVGTLHATTATAAGLLGRRGWQHRRNLCDGWCVYALEL